MKHILGTLLPVVMGVFMYAQPSVQPLIRAEKDFEKQSHKEGIKKAFLYFADAGGLMFTDTGAINAHTFWNTRPDNGGFYSWAPSYAEISGGGNWGYTTGAAQFRRKSLDDTVAFASQYTTVWKKDIAGNWKYLMDIGISHASIPPDTACKTVLVNKEKTKSLTSVDVLQLDKRFSNMVVTNMKAAYSKFSGKHYLVNSEGQFIKTSSDSAIKMLKDRLTACVPTAVLVAPAGDMAFVYGRFSRGERQANYVRIWRQEATGWKIALEVFQ